MTTDLFGTPPAIHTGASTTTKRLGKRLLTLGFVVSTAAALFVGGMGATVSAAPADGTTETQVLVTGGITLSALDPSFLMTGAPGELIPGGPGAFNVITNNATGYSVTVEAALATLTGPGADTIPIATLEVQDAADAFVPMSSTEPVTIYTQGTRSAPTGDLITKAYQMLVPSVVVGTYVVTLNYLAIATVA